MLSQQLREDLENIIEYTGYKYQGTVKHGGKNIPAQFGIAGRQGYRRSKAEDQYYGSQQRAPEAAKAQAAKVFKQKRQLRMAQDRGKSPRVAHMRTGRLEPY